MSEHIKKRQLTFSGDSPTQIVVISEADSLEPDADQARVVTTVGKTFRAYVTAVEELLNTKYSHLRGLVPAHLADPGLVLIGCCAEGVVVRYERRPEGHREDRTRVISSWLSQGLPQLVSWFSQELIHCYPTRDYVSTVPTTGTKLEFFSEDPIAKTRKDVFSVVMGFDVVLERPERMPQPPQKPFCMLSVQSTFEINLQGELLSEDADTAKGQPFLSRTLFRLPVGWDCIEVFPFFELEQWKPEYASVWAENDLLSAVVIQQLAEARFQSLDPNSAARIRFAKLFKDYKELLDSNPEREEILQRFLRDNPVLLCPAHTNVWPKLSLGARKTDFVFRQATGDYLLVELERSTFPLFVKDGHPSSELNHAHGQVIDWRRYLEDNLSTVQRELGLAGISANPNCLIVIGRGPSLTPDNKRRLITMENESPKLKIMTYDDVYEDAKAIVENLLGIL